MTTDNSKRRNVSYPLRCMLLSNMGHYAGDLAYESVEYSDNYNSEFYKSEFPEISCEPLHATLNWLHGYKIYLGMTARVHEFGFNSAELIRDNCKYLMYPGMATIENPQKP